jgi:hypothetical protein
MESNGRAAGFGFPASAQGEHNLVGRGGKFDYLHIYSNTYADTDISLYDVIFAPKKFAHG